VPGIPDVEGDAPAGDGITGCGRRALGRRRGGAGANTARSGRHGERPGTGGAGRPRAGERPTRRSGGAARGARIAPRGSAADEAPLRRAGFPYPVRRLTSRRRPRDRLTRAQPAVPGTWPAGPGNRMGAAGGVATGWQGQATVALLAGARREAGHGQSRRHRVPDQVKRAFGAVRQRADRAGPAPSTRSACRPEHAPLGAGRPGQRVSPAFRWGGLLRSHGISAMEFPLLGGGPDRPAPEDALGPTLTYRMRRTSPARGSGCASVRFPVVLSLG